MRRLNRFIAVFVGIVTAVGVSIGIGASAPATSPPPSIVASAAQSGDGGVSSAEGSVGGDVASVDTNCVTFPLSPFYSGVSTGRAGELASHPVVSGLAAELQAAIAASPTGSGTLYRYNCNGQTESSHWCPDGAACTAVPTVTVDDLVPGVLDEVRRTIPAPVLDMSPGADVGGIVNVGLWLAIVEPPPVTARAEAGSVWAQAQATLRGLTWDMGNGDVVECAGYGDPIVDEDTLEPSPVCGYNYDQPSTPEFTGGGDAYQVSVTAHWDVRVTGSDGRDVAADPIDVPLAFDYVVSEVQTIGN